MEKLRYFILNFVLMLIMCNLTVSASAELILQEPVPGEFVVLDTDFNLMWLQDASLGGIFMTGYDAITWAETLEYAGYDDWRLPNTDSDDYCTEYNCTNSEMGHLYYIEGVTSSDPGLFDNVQSTWYWSRTEWLEDAHWIPVCF
jgi:hypothetical protein